MCFSSSWTNHVGELLVLVSHISGLIDMDRLSWWRGFMRLRRLATSWWSVVGDHLGDGWPLISWSSYYVFPSKGGNVFQTLRWYPPLKDTRDCWHQENGTSSFVCHHSHKSRRQNVSGQLQSWTFDKATAYKLDWIVFAHSGCLLKIGFLKQCCKTVFVNVIWNTLKGRVRFYSKAFWKKYLTNHHQIDYTMICFYFEVLSC